MGILGENRLMTLPEAARFVSKKTGMRISPVTVWRWAKRPVDGVELQVVGFGRRLFVSAESLEAYGLAIGKLPPRPRKKKDGGGTIDETEVDALLEDLKAAPRRVRRERGRRKVRV